MSTPFSLFSAVSCLVIALLTCARVDVAAHLTAEKGVGWSNRRALEAAPSSQSTHRNVRRVAGVVPQDGNVEERGLPLTPEQVKDLVEETIYHAKANFLESIDKQLDTEQQEAATTRLMTQFEVLHDLDLSSDDVQELFLTQGRGAFDDVSRFVVELYKEYRGMQPLRPTAEEVETFRDVLIPVKETYLESVNDQLDGEQQGTAANKLRKHFEGWYKMGMTRKRVMYLLRAREGLENVDRRIALAYIRYYDKLPLKRKTSKHTSQ